MENNIDRAYDRSKYKVYTWKNFMMLHWVINPGLAFNELFLGQRIPKVMLAEKNKSLIEGSAIPCPHCKKLHDGRTWSAQNGTAFGNWFGLYCYNCGKIIPCLINALSFIILIITFILWGWFRKTFKEKWLAKQPERYKNLDLNFKPTGFEGSGWIAKGLGFGFFMFILNAFLIPLLMDNKITWASIIIAIPIWILGGLAFGYILKKMMYRILTRNAS